MRISDWSSDVCSSDLPFSLYARSIRSFSQLGFVFDLRALRATAQSLALVALLFLGPLAELSTGAAALDWDASLTTFRALVYAPIVEELRPEARSVRKEGVST